MLLMHHGSRNGLNMDHIHSNLWHVVARTGVSQTNLRRDKTEFGKIELFGLFEDL